MSVLPYASDLRNIPDIAKRKLARSVPCLPSTDRATMPWTVPLAVEEIPRGTRLVEVSRRWLVFTLNRNDFTYLGM